MCIRDRNIPIETKLKPMINVRPNNKLQDTIDVYKRQPRHNHVFRSECQLHRRVRQTDYVTRYESHATYYAHLRTKIIKIIFWIIKANYYHI